MEKKLMKALCDSLHYDFDEEACKMTLDNKKTVANLIANGVTVPVRCKDCEYLETYSYGDGFICECPKNGRTVNFDDYCSEGRKTKA